MSSGDEYMLLLQQYGLLAENKLTTSVMANVGISTRAQGSPGHVHRTLRIMEW